MPIEYVHEFQNNMIQIQYSDISMKIRVSFSSFLLSYTVDRSTDITAPIAHALLVKLFISPQQYFNIMLKCFIANIFIISKLLP